MPPPEDGAGDGHAFIGTADAVHMTAEECASRLGVDAFTGLSEEQVRRRRIAHAPNELEAEEEEPLYMKFFSTFKDPLIGLLLASCLVSLVMGQYDDAISIFMAVAIVGTVAFVQEYRSEQSLAALNQLVPPHAMCLRGGIASDIMARELVPGDIVLIVAGDRVPADCRLLESTSLMTDDSSLTGEDHPHDKHAEVVINVSGGQRLPLAECSNLIFMGSLACAGHARAVVTATGMHSEFGKVFSDLKEVENRRTPLQVKMDELGKQLSLISFAIIGVIALVGWIQGKPMLDMFTIGVSLAVAAIPEGLPICVTVTLALGVMRMAKRNAIVKKLPAVEALGCATVVCVDKTGTVTQNQMTVREVFLPSEGHTVEVSGGGYDASKGEFTLAGEKIDTGSHTGLYCLLEAACLCNNAHLEGSGGAEQGASRDTGGAPRGAPTELALLVAAAKWGMDDPRPRHQRLQEVPFSSDRKLMEVRCRLSAGSADLIYYVKGSTESVLALCNASTGRMGEIVALSDLDRRRAEDAAFRLGSMGRRVIAVAYGPNAQALSFAGLVGIVDPIRPGVNAAVKEMQLCQTRLCMITGDAEETAVAIASEAGFYDPASHRALSGTEMEHMSQSDLESVIHQVAVFFRTSPRHKLSIVRALQSIGEVVAMTGDGINDSPALKAADIGVAMGTSGTDVAKEAADVILIDDDFATIVAAIEEGKGIFYNIRNFLTFQLSTSVAALSLVAVATFFGLPSPLNAMQILWINIIMDGPPAQSLGVEPVQSCVITRPPRKRTEPVITTRLLARVLSSGALIVIGTLLVFMWEMSDNVDGEASRRTTTITFTTFVLFDMFNAMCCRSADRPVHSMEPFTNKPFGYAVGASLIGQLLVIYFPPLQVRDLLLGLGATPRYSLLSALLVRESSKRRRLASVIWSE